LHFLHEDFKWVSLFEYADGKKISWRIHVSRNCIFFMRFLSNGFTLWICRLEKKISSGRRIHVCRLKNCNLLQLEISKMISATLEFADKLKPLSIMKKKNSCV
jgi:hypothetical protein